MVGKLEGKIALITGGSTGIGLTTAQLFVEEGAFVFITGRRQNELDEAVKVIGKNIVGVRGDVAKNEDLDRLFDIIRSDKGKLDIVFANAGIGKFTPLESTTEEDFYSILNVNVKGVFFTVQKAISLISDGGSIILNASIASSKALDHMSVYSASKAAVRSFARSWANDLKLRKIRVNVISPGPIDTPILSSVVDDDKKDEIFAEYSKQIPLRRIGAPIEIAKPVLFLASDDSSYINGIELFADGGLVSV